MTAGSLRCLLAVTGELMVEHWSTIADDSETRYTVAVTSELLGALLTDNPARADELADRLRDLGD